MVNKSDDIDLLSKLISENTSLAVAREWLARNGLKHSASSWHEFREKRVLPALDKGAIKKADLLTLLQDAEESGRQHVFIFSISKSAAKKLVEPRALQAALRKADLEDVYLSDEIIDLPDSLALTHARIEEKSNLACRSLIIKLIGAIKRWEFVGEDTEADGSKVVRYKPVIERCVNIARVFENGAVEIRIQSHRSSSRYENELNAVLELLAPILPVEKFVPVSLGSAKRMLWEDRKRLKKAIRYSDSKLTNTFGTTLSAATGNKDSALADDPAVTESVNSYYKNNGHFSGSNIWFLKDFNGLSRDVHVHLAGEVNEFAVPAQCTRDDYEYIFAEILRLNESVSG